MKTLYYLSFNNYYNRLVKRYETIDEYLNNSTLCASFDRDVNFNPNDGITAQHTPYLATFTSIPDYLLVTEDGVIQSRWFVMEARYNTGKTQFICSLYRDLVAEFWNDVVNKPFYCEKGWLSVLDNGIFNDEAITTNQIKKEEYPITDGSGIPWLVGYMATPDNDEDIPEVEYYTNTVYPDITVSSLEEWESYNRQERFIDDYLLSYYYYKSNDDQMWHAPFKPDVEGTPTKGTTSFQTWYSGIKPSKLCKRAAEYSAMERYRSRVIAGVLNELDAIINPAQKATMLNLDGKILKDESTGKVYTIRATVRKENATYQTVRADSSLYNVMRDMMRDELDFGGTITNSNTEISYTVSDVLLRAVELEMQTGKVKISKLRRTLTDQPMSMFCMPYGVFPMKMTPQTVIASSAQESLNVCTALLSQLSSYIYDIQILPYCPIPKFRVSDPSQLDPIATTLQIDVDYTPCVDSENITRTIMFWCDVSSGSLTVDSPKAFTLPDNAVDFKVGCQTEFWRISSPNYSGVFEFSPYKNRGVDYFQIDYTYKPYQPYIRVAPNFGGLYGSDFGDARGLIVNGDFSITRTEDAFATYELQNKNYQVMFNRQIENMEVQHKYQKIEQIVGAFTGTASGGITGGIAGSSGGPYAALAGALIGGTASAAGGIADYKIGEALRSEALDYTRDLFGYQLENIKALPYSLTKVTAFNVNNKLFPFIEVFDCTPEEKEAVRNKIIYNGMTVERIGTIEQFTGSQERQYVKGQLIRFEGLNEDSHVLTTLSNELYKGVFV